jgi:predicted amidohydrolase
MSDSRELTSHVCLIATGVAYCKLDIPGADKFAGAGVYYGAAKTEAMSCAEAEVYLDGIAASTATGPAILCGTALAADGNASGKRARNVAALLSGGRVTFLQQKMLLPFYDVFDEQRYFEPAQHQSVTMLDGQPLAITVCEDARAAADSNIRVHWMSLGELSRLIGTFQAEGITRAVMAGQVKPDQWRKG